MEKLENNYFVLIADIINSRSIENRFEIQEKYILLSQTLNNKYNDDIASKFIVTMGDEMEGLLKEPKNLFSIIKDIETTMFPIKLRFSIGVGSINTKIDFENSIRIDGDAYHRARLGIDTIKTLNKKNPNTYRIMIKSSHEVCDKLLNSNLMLCNSLRESWTKKQDSIVNVYELCNKDQGETALQLSVSQSYISKTLKVILYKSYCDALKTISDTIVHGISD